MKTPVLLLIGLILFAILPISKTLLYSCSSLFFGKAEQRKFDQF
ncbi:MAG: hypothetical protein NTV01_18290 [Bacteroidia bacterium]|nr:hypothetical protein [Bacteroidia bacterium]